MTDSPKSIAEEIRALSVSDKLRLAADSIDSGRVASSLVLNVVRLALSELEGRISGRER